MLRRWPIERICDPTDALMAYFQQCFRESAMRCYVHTEVSSTYSLLPSFLAYIFHLNAHFMI